MKRSDAIKQLKYWLFGASNNPNHQNEATALLNKIEEMGLLPPQTNKLAPIGEIKAINNDTGVINFNTVNTIQRVNEWDDE